MVFDDPRQCLDAVGDIRETALLGAAVHQANGRAFDQVQDQLGDGSRTANACRIQAVQTRSHPVEWAKQGELQAFLAIGPDDPVQQLLGHRVDPALLVDRANDQVRGVLVEVGVLAHAIDFGRGRENHALVVLHAVADDLQVLFEIQLEDSQWIARVFNRRGDGHQRQHDIAFLDVVFDPLGMDADVTFDEMKVWLGSQALDGVRADIHAVDFVTIILQQTL